MHSHDSQTPTTIILSFVLSLNYLAPEEGKQPPNNTNSNQAPSVEQEPQNDHPNYEVEEDTDDMMFSQQRYSPPPPDFEFDDFNRDTDEEEEGELSLLDR